jgi:hypothetical protein
MWSKSRRFVEVLHVVGDILTNISANYVINLHAAIFFYMLSFMGLSYAWL